MTDLFPQANNEWSAGFNVDRIIILINNKKFEGLLADNMGGIQPYRTQFNVTVNGDIHVLSAGKGLGTQEFTVFEGPFKCGAAIDCMADYYDSIDDINERVIKIVYVNATSKAPVFSGIINGMASTQSVNNDGTITMITKVGALGTWK